ncbi:uncharacterized protein LOC124641835 [Helicoverpa zea]|uniref:uncharacterized protein LOC124641835 n=1 Tax=Helicoverpa zea TaxID=7113 RepID=UPI001F5A3DB8|nr:uncharacterized protein LOC124641835 [Helicoverpa zea]
MQESEIESEENDQNSYIVGDDVTYLKDSGKEPSINTLIQQDLMQFQLPEPILGSACFISSSRTDSPISGEILPFSQDPMLNAACKLTTCSNYDLGKYSPEIVPNPQRRRRRTKKPTSNQMAPENEPLQQLQLQAQLNKVDCHSSNVSAPKDLVLDSKGPVITSPEIIPAKKQCTIQIKPTNTSHKSRSPDLEIQDHTKSSQSRALIEKQHDTDYHMTDTNNSTPQPEKKYHRSSTPIPISIITLNAPRNSSFDVVVDELPLDLSMKEYITQDNINNNHQHLPACEGKMPIPPVSSTFHTPSSLISLSLAVISKESLTLLVHSSKDLLPTVEKQSCPIPSTSRADSVSPRPSFNFDDPWNSDFSPDDGDPDYQPSEQLNTSHTSNESLTLEPVDETRVKRKRAKRGKANKENWTYNQNKIKRMKGESYSGRRKTEDGKIVFDLEKNERSVQPRCDHNDSCKYFDCYKLTEEDRNMLFKNYWKLSWDTKKIWVQQTVQKLGVSKRKCSGNSFRRGNTFKYSFNVLGEKYKVCKKMYLNTLNIGEWSVHNWAKNEDRDEVASESDKTHRNNSVKAFENIGRNHAIEFLNNLPKLESHYCRKTTSKLYLEQIWQSKEQLYREYVKQLLDKGINEYKVSQKIFFQEFDAMNLSLFSPKKDQCDLCCAFKVGNIAEEVYTAHREKKERARQEKTADKNNPDPETMVFTFDLQAVLLSPSLKASALYYKTKLKVHNFTLFNIKNNDGYCYIWHECEGGLSANEFCSILQHFIKHYIPQNVKKIIFWSDGCTNQNRNAILANALLQIAVQKEITITQKYLEKGHTQMEADSMHSTIERQLRNREIYSPAQYIDVCRNARLNKPYVVNYLDHSIFRKFSSMPYLNSIRPGKKAGEATVFDLRCIEYRTDGTIYIKQEFSEEFEQLRRKIKKPRDSDSMPRLYDARIPIPRTKYIHLQELKEVLPQDVHLFYDSLPHECPGNGRNGNICTCRKNILSEES